MRRPGMSVHGHVRAWPCTCTTMSIGNSLQNDRSMTIHGRGHVDTWTAVRRASPGGRARALRLGGLLRLSRGRTGVAGAGSCLGALLRLRLAAVLARRLSGALAV